MMDNVKTNNHTLSIKTKEPRFSCEWPRSKYYSRTAALGQPCDEGDWFFSGFPSNGAPVE
jgi:hypothetical protein